MRLTRPKMQWKKLVGHCVCVCPKKESGKKLLFPTTLRGKAQCIEKSRQEDLFI